MKEKAPIDYKKRAHALNCKLYRRDAKIAALEQQIEQLNQQQEDLMEKYELLALQSAKHQSKYHAELRNTKFWRTTAFFFAGLWIFTLILVVVKL